MVLAHSQKTKMVIEGNNNMLETKDPFNQDPQ